MEESARTRRLFDSREARYRRCHCIDGAGEEKREGEADGGGETMVMNAHMVIFDVTTMMPIKVNPLI